MRRLRQEDGVTLMELLIGATIGVILSLALYGFLDTTSRSSERTAARIDAAKLGRPVMASIVDRLHSTCVAADAIPIRAGSTSQRIYFLHKTGDAVTLTPSLHEIRWVQTQLPEGRLVEYVYPRTGGSAPDWTFASSGSQRTLLEPVERGPNNGIFTYYVYNSSGSLAALPANTVLNDDTAAKVVQVGINFKVPSRVDDDDEGGTTFTDTVLLRFTPPAVDAGTDTLACT